MTDFDSDFIKDFDDISASVRQGRTTASRLEVDSANMLETFDVCTRCATSPSAAEWAVGCGL